MLREAFEKIRDNAPLTNLLVLANVLVFIVMEIYGSTEDTVYMLEHGAAYAPAIIEGGEYYRVFTSMFMHFGIGHLFNNMLVLFFVGDNLERAVGKIRFLFTYLLSGLGAGTASLLYHMYANDNTVSAGASGAVFGVIGALFYIVLINKGKMEDLSAGRLGFLIVFSIYHGLSESGVDNIAHAGGVIAGLLLAVILYRRKKPACCFKDDIIK